jgi:hypothetical protein
VIDGMKSAAGALQTMREEGGRGAPVNAHFRKISSCWTAQGLLRPGVQAKRPPLIHQRNGPNGVESLLEVLVPRPQIEGIGDWRYKAKREDLDAQLECFKHRTNLLLVMVAGDENGVWLEIRDVTGRNHWASGDRRSVL